MALRQGERTPLPLDFKGDRTYLHGTDMLDALCGIAPDLRNISLKIQKIAEDPVAAVGLPDDGINRRDLVAILAADENGSRIEIGLEPAPSGKLPGRYAYDEAGVIAAATFAPAEKTAQMPRNPEHSFIEQLVALQKALLQRCFPMPGSTGTFRGWRSRSCPTDSACSRSRSSRHSAPAWSSRPSTLTALPWVTFTSLG